MLSGDTAADTFVSLEQTVAVVGVVFKFPLGSEQTSHFTDVAAALRDCWFPLAMNSHHCL